MTARFDTAIVLAAGAGRRLKPVSETPKPLLPLSGQPGDERFLDFHLRAAKEVGCRAVVIVGNRAVTRAPLRSILTLGPGIEVRMVENPADPVEHGTARSLSRGLEEARELVDGKRLLIINAGLVYSDGALRSLAAHDESRSAVLVGQTGVTEVWGQALRASRLGRALSGTPVVEGLLPHGRVVGLWSIAAADTERLRLTALWALAHTSGGKKARLDEVVQILAERGRVDAVTLAAADMAHAVDTPDDYARLITDVWPALKASRAG